MSSSTRDAAGKRVLIVEDNADTAELLRMLLVLEGHVVQVASDGPAALERAKEFEPEAIVLDLGLPKMDGVEVASRIRAMASGAVMRLIAVTGWGQAAVRERVLRAGFDCCLSKPVDPRQLVSIIAG